MGVCIIIMVHICYEHKVIHIYNYSYVTVVQISCVLGMCKILSSPKTILNVCMIANHVRNLQQLYSSVLTIMQGLELSGILSLN